MSKIVFWDMGYGGSAEVAGAFGVQAGLHEKYHLLLLNCGYAGTGMEEGFPPRDMVLDHDLRLPVRDQGMEALQRLAESGRLPQCNLMDYTYPLLPGRLDLADGLQAKGESVRHSLPPAELGAIVSMAEQCYDIVIMQESALNASLLDNPGLRKDDTLIAVLRQNRVELDTFFEMSGTSAFSNGSTPQAIIVHQYDAASKWSLQNIKRRYNCDVAMIGIPYHTEFSDAWNGQDIISFFRRYRLLKGRGYEREQFLFSCKELVRIALAAKERSGGPMMDSKVKGA
ncbi:hypothetical protein [Paenibacillus ihumii]|uniref:hypothetical protein n=1 Tax=Paenibacillus ihumii TaxID=687436 RepID=UPI0006D8045C|nr:hypothetical protein [Paenibacillus ihumii]